MNYAIVHLDAYGPGPIGDTTRTTVTIDFGATPTQKGTNQ